jgi:hypothetical protein
MKQLEHKSSVNSNFEEEGLGNNHLMFAIIITKPVVFTSSRVALIVL